MGGCVSRGLTICGAQSTPTYPNLHSVPLIKKSQRSGGFYISQVTVIAMNFYRGTKSIFCILFMYLYYIQSLRSRATAVIESRLSLE